MNGHDDSIAEAIPWVANGSATDQERRRVESHLPTCEACRELMDQALELASPGIDATELGGHPPAAILQTLVEEPGRILEETRDRLEAHLRDCAACRSAVEALGDLELGREARPGTVGKGPWSWLAGTILSPVMAAAYLLTLAVGLGWFVTDRPSPRDGTGILPPAIPLPGEVIFRDAPGGESPPILLDLPPAPDKPVHLSLETDIDDSDLGDPAASFEIRLTQSERIVWSRSVPGSDFSKMGRLDLLLPSALLRAAPVTRIEILLDNPGDPMHGETLYIRSTGVR